MITFTVFSAATPFPSLAAVPVVLVVTMASLFPVFSVATRFLRLPASATGPIPTVPVPAVFPPPSSRVPLVAIRFSSSVSIFLLASSSVPISQLLTISIPVSVAALLATISRPRSVPRLNYILPRLRISRLVVRPRTAHRRPRGGGDGRLGPSVFRREIGARGFRRPGASVGRRQWKRRLLPLVVVVLASPHVVVVVVHSCCRGLLHNSWGWLGELLLLALDRPHMSLVLGDETGVPFGLAFLCCCCRFCCCCSCFRCLIWTCGGGGWKCRPVMG
mmetsp:Transcript_56535/g.120262  ORF Transcript_56535/g.120262 Transcript_56535/m.120262 type:complete len:275 (-) Transcript_56535:1220-2044(-)